MEKFSADTLSSHGIKVSQPETGYRFSMDPFLLAAHVSPAGNEKIIDAGCGCGIIPLLLLSRYPHLVVTGVEIQEELSLFAKKNVRDNQFHHSIRIIHGDITEIDASRINGPADILISNPPYKKKGSGRTNPCSQKAIARHEITLTIEGLVKCSKRLLKPQGRIILIFPAQRLPDLILALERHTFFVETLRFIHIKKNTPALRVILCAKRNTRKPCVVKPPFYVYESENRFTDEYISVLTP